MLNHLLLDLAQFLDAQAASTSLHESYYLYGWIETAHVLTLTVFLGMLLIIDLRMLGLAFRSVPASVIAARLDRPMMIGFAVMVITGLALFYAIPVRTTQSIWFRLKVVLLLVAGLNAFLFRRAMRNSVSDWDHDSSPPARIRAGAILSLCLWTGVIATGRSIAYDWFDCHQQLPRVMYWAAGCVAELESF